jgi:hypothetical protein
VSGAAMEEIERHFEKLTKILARVAGAGTTTGERANAARLSAKYLADHPMPLRWFVPKGTVCQVVPAQYMRNLTEAKKIIRHVSLHKNEMFPEQLRVKVEDEVALGAGYLYFERYGYAIFVPVQDVAVRL